MGREKEGKISVNLRKSTEQRQNRCVKGSQNGLYAKKEPSKGTYLTRLSNGFYGCFKRRFCDR